MPTIDELTTLARATSKLAAGSDGIYHEFASGEIARFDGLGALLEPSATNGVRNNTNVGQVGLGLPDNWGAAVSGGLTTDVTGVGTEDGLPFTEIRVHGTASAGQWFLAVEPTNGLMVSPTDVWTLHMGVRVIDSTLPPNMYQTRFREQTGASVVNNVNQSFVPSGVRTLISHTKTIPASIDNVRPGLAANITNGQPYDFTFRVYAIQMELGSRATSPILTSGVATTRAADQLYVDGLTGTYDLTITLDDDSTIPVVSWDATTPIPLTGIDGRYVKSIASN